MMKRAVYVAMVTALLVGPIAAQNQQLKLPEVRNGKVVGGPPPPPPKTYPNVEDGRIETSRDKSFGGSVDPSKGSVEGNYRFPIPQKKK